MHRTGGVPERCLLILSRMADIRRGLLSQSKQDPLADREGFGISVDE